MMGGVRWDDGEGFDGGCGGARGEGRGKGREDQLSQPVRGRQPAFHRSQYRSAIIVGR